MSAAVACDPNETSKCSDVYTTARSPDGRFLVEVRRCEMRYAAPGQGGDAPGIIRLVDLTNGKELKRKRIDIVSTFTGAEWSERRVSIPLLVDWDLPTSAKH